MNINIISTFRDNETKEKRLNNVITGLPRWHSGKESACNSGDAGLIPGLERSPRKGNDNPLQYSCIKKKKKPVDREAW